MLSLNDLRFGLDPKLGDILHIFNDSIEFHHHVA